jgi:DNA-binding SARP family transcriptional activator
VNSSNDPHARPLAGSGALVHPLSVRLLGGLRLAGVREGDATGYESRHHVRAVLALAGSSSHGMLRDEMVELLWPNSRAEAARNRLYHTVHLARQALAVFAWDDEWLVVRNGRVLFDERVWCDVHELERAVETGVATPTGFQAWKSAAPVKRCACGFAAFRPRCCAKLSVAMPLKATPRRSVSCCRT